jgi:hypothetical protein
MPQDKFDEEPVTLIPCVVCDGNFEIPQRDTRREPETCPWCTQGSMSDRQLQKWKLYRANIKA